MNFNFKYFQITKLLAGKNFGSNKTWIVVELDTDEQQSEREPSEFVVDSDIQVLTQQFYIILQILES